MAETNPLRDLDYEVKKTERTGPQFRTVNVKQETSVKGSG
jgi:hypothetical protein